MRQEKIASSPRIPLHDIAGDAVHEGNIEDFVPDHYAAEHGAARLLQRGIEGFPEVRHFERVDCDDLGAATPDDVPRDTWFNIDRAQVDCASRCQGKMARGSAASARQRESKCCDLE